MSYKYISSICLLAACVAQLSEAAPTLTVAPVGLNPSNNWLWNVQVTPDFALAPSGTPLAVELAFAIDHTDLVSVDVNTAVWDTANPGNNPFTGTITNGLWLDLIGDRTFGAFGSVDITVPGPVDLFLIETAGSGLTTLRYGVAASGHPSHGARISQVVGNTALNFDGYSGTITVPEPASLCMSAIATSLICTTAGRWRRKKSS